MSPEKPRGRPAKTASAKSTSTDSITGTEYLYGVGRLGEVIELPITRRTPKRVYFTISDCEVYVSRADLERDGHVTHGYGGWADEIGPAVYATRPPGAANLIPAGIPVAIPPPDSGRNDSGEGDDLWTQLARGDWSSSAAAYATATVARQIIDSTPMTVAAFAGECKRRNITGWQSQGSVSRRLRWASLHDECWTTGILPPGVFLSESATRPLFDGKLTRAQRLQLLAELFGPHLTDEQKRKLAAELSEALMREHLAKHADSGPEYKAPRVPVLDTTVAKLLVHYPADAIHDAIDRLDHSARNAAEGTG
jgi:hypothetical protein